MADDCKRDVKRRGGRDAEEMKTIVRAICLLEIEKLLKANNASRTLGKVGLPDLTEDERRLAEAEFVSYLPWYLPGTWYCKNIWIRS